jgi:Tfp pilus assembly protein PilF
MRAECFSALRVGQALGQLDEATKDLKQVLALDPANKAAEKQLALVRQKQRVQDSKDKVPPPPRRVRLVQEEGRDVSS